MELVLRLQLPVLLTLTNMWSLSDLCVGAYWCQEALGHGCIIPWSAACA